MTVQIFGGGVFLLWIVVATGTAVNAMRGKLFEAPCLRELERRCGNGADKEQHET